MLAELQTRFAVKVPCEKRLRAEKVRTLLNEKRAELPMNTRPVQGQLMVGGIFSGVGTGVLHGNTYAVGVLVEETPGTDGKAIRLKDPLTYEKVNLSAFDFRNDVRGRLQADWGHFKPLKTVDAPTLASELVKLCGSSTDFDLNKQTAGGTAPPEAPTLARAAELRAAHLRATEAEKKLQDAEKATRAAEAATKTAEAATKTAAAARKKAQAELKKKQPDLSVSLSTAQLKAIKDAATKGSRAGLGVSSKAKTPTASGLSKTTTRLLLKAKTKHFLRSHALGNGREEV
jgi:hypothetical protein